MKKLLSPVPNTKTIRKFCSTCSHRHSTTLHQISSRNNVKKNSYGK